MILCCRDLKKNFDQGPVLTGGYFHLEEKEKAAVVGINGAGKSTLLNLITGRLEPDGGEVMIRSGRTLGYLTQHSTLESFRSIYEETASACAEILAMEQQLRQLERDIARAGEEGDSGAAETLGARYSELTHRYEAENGYAVHSEIIGVLKGLGFTEDEFSRPCGLLSGGEKTRVSLGKLLLRKPDILLLDEPTNHLDISSVTWLEGYLKDLPGALLLVSHDRYFLDKIVTKVIEVERGVFKSFAGNYTAYAAKKAQERENYRKAYEKQQAQIRHEEDVITKLRSFNREKSIRRAESREKRLEHIERLERPQEIRDRMHFAVRTGALSGQDVLRAEELKMVFSSTALFSEVSLELKRGEHVGLIGDNGCGKTTLLKILCGKLRPTSGSVRLGAKVTVGYYDQEQQLLTEENTLLEELQSTYPKMTDTEVRSVLAAFLFTGDDVFKPVSALSGGERGRLSLCKLILSPCNLLILDEPTNHLDMPSREVLEEALLDYSGTLLVVSHDRYFLNRVTTRTLEMAAGTLTSYLGNYDAYREKKQQLEAWRAAAGSAAVSGRSPAVTSSGPVPAAPSAPSSQAERLARKEQETLRRRKENERKRLEQRIEALEEEDASCLARYEAPENASSVSLLMELSSRREAIAAELAQLYESWESLDG